MRNDCLVLALAVLSPLAVATSLRTPRLLSHLQLFATANVNIAPALPCTSSDQVVG